MPNISSEEKAKANDLKAKGNTAFGKKDFNAALDYYTQAIKLDSTEPIFLSNRAACYLQLQNWAAAESDCNLALVMMGQLANDNVPNPKAGVKLLYRRGVSRRAQGRLAQAKTDWERALALDPDNKSAREDLNALAWELKKQERNSRGTTKSRPRTTSSDTKPSSTATITAESTTAVQRNIPIQIVDSLPKEFVFTQAHGPTEATTAGSQPTAATETPASLALIAPEKETAPIDLQSSSQMSSRISPRQIPSSFPRTPNLYDLTQLIRRLQSERLQVLAYFFHSIPPVQLPSIFGRGGIEGEFIETFLDAIIVHGEDVEHSTEREFVDRSTQLLKGMAACDRFSIAKVFIDDKKVVKAFAVCNNIAQKCGGDVVSQVAVAKNLWNSM
ncbi:hypothetical protein V1525DRAFT_433301 [Lipomyces kononenkoae]|uniref:Uncharacterized protein n=1 Tax=Lipomyces kononenkoae TaxID=34357 RepID=A0ACC3SZ10_LIPKO